MQSKIINVQELIKLHASSLSHGGSNVSNIALVGNKLTFNTPTNALHAQIIKNAISGETFFTIGKKYKVLMKFSHTSIGDKSFTINSISNGIINDYTINDETIYVASTRFDF